MSPLRGDIVQDEQRSLSAKLIAKSKLGTSNGLSQMLGNALLILNVIKAIGGTEYTWRYLDNIINDSGLSFEVARDNLNWLIINKLATEYDGVNGKVYALSAKGQTAFRDIINS